MIVQGRARQPGVAATGCAPWDRGPMGRGACVGPHLVEPGADAVAVCGSPRRVCPRMRPELRHRLTLGPLIAGAVFGLLAWDFASGRHLGLLAILAVSVAFGCRELQRMAREATGPVQIMPMVVISYCLLFSAYVRGDPTAGAYLREHSIYLIDRLQGMPLTEVLLALGLVWATLIQMSRRAWELFFTNVSLTMFGMIYIGVTVSLMLGLAMVPGTAGYYGEPGDAHAVTYANRGNQLLLLYITSCKLGDVTAFFGGKAFGRHKMAPRISPGKTWEGFACSFVGAIGGAYLLSWAFSQWCDHGPFNAWWQPAVWGLVLGPLGVVGDLAESCMKRQASRKDSGASIPGFGGWLDLFDALILAAPVAYVLALIL